MACALLQRKKLCKEKMMNEEQQITWLRSLREYLRQGNTVRLTEQVKEMGLENLLDPTFLNLAINNKAYQVIIFIATIGEANDYKKERFDRILAAYQYLAGQIDIDIAAEKCAGNKKNINFYKQVLLSSTSKSHEPIFKTEKASDNDYEFAVGFLLNTERIDAIITLLEYWNKINPTAIPWLKTCKMVVQRTEEIVQQNEAGELSMLVEKLINTSPKSQTAVIQELINYWASISLKSQKPENSLKSTKAALIQKSSYDQILNYAKALIINQLYENAIEQIEKLIGISVQEHAIHNAQSRQNSNTFNTKEAEETLITVNHLLISKGLKPFLMSGTLLGYARNNELLPHDKDIDLGIIGWENQFTIAHTLLESGIFKFDPVQLTGSNRYLLSANDLRTGVAIDFFLFHESRDFFIHGIDFDLGFTQNYKFSKFNLKEVEFLNNTFYIPDNFDKNLNENYGDWKKPDQDYIVTLESPAIISTNPIIRKLILHLELLKNVRLDIKSNKTKRIIKMAQGEIKAKLVDEILIAQGKLLNQENWISQITKGKK
jgi:hypothetical protein